MVVKNQLPAKLEVEFVVKSFDAFENLGCLFRQILLYIKDDSFVRLIGPSVCFLRTRAC